MINVFPKLLLHSCCAGCTPKVLEALTKEYNVTGYWFNPNIYPEEEYQKRLDALKTYSRQEKYELIISENPSQSPFDRSRFRRNKGRIKRGISVSKTDRCRFCYDGRIRSCAEEAKKDNINYFTTTLLVSPYQEHKIIRELGEQIARQVGVEFVYRDFRPMFYAGKTVIYNQKLYMQKYCGCVYSLKERNKK
ncbi:MAG: hypothetical protein AUJ85_01990 [Elusimicrobia bacterium CG1_02_37_114]|nr:MAG: hypothetical protein AUJ85_01990 [Elusimicrobia bacterium CG1_02_37_114]PIV53050.1 MAG: hypothetical protein COS17_05865 [Elusimicrobia bacterium CG02_land_8_20_14_3_00_37_13]PIZ12555.1 MAG: hypothetical protein COY53_09400 [Elusimicrobia bacterium CG_4_10_14_0_8_um_filter_37_32]